MNASSSAGSAPSSRLLGGGVAFSVLGLLLAYLLWSAIVPPFDAAWQELVDDAAMLPLRIAVAWLALQLARAPDATPTERRAWQWFGWSFVISSAAAAIRLAGTSGLSFPTGWRLPAAVVQVGLMLGGLWLLTRLRRESGRTADWFDAGVMVVAGFLLASHFIVQGDPFVSDHLGARRWLFLLYLLADVLAVLLVATCWFRRPDGLSRLMLGLMSSGFAVIAMADLFTGAHHVVPPADVLQVVGVLAGDMVRGVQRMAHQHRIRARRIQFAIRLVGDFEFGQHRAALQLEWLGKACFLRRDDHCNPWNEKTRSAFARTGLGYGRRVSRSQPGLFSEYL